MIMKNCLYDATLTKIRRKANEGDVGNDENIATFAKIKLLLKAKAIEVTIQLLWQPLKVLCIL